MKVHVLAITYRLPPSSITYRLPPSSISYQPPANQLTSYQLPATS